MSAHAVIDVEEGEISKSNGSRFNAVKHGLTAKTAVLPGEDPAQFQAKIDLYRESIGPRNALEDDLAGKAALASWQMDRAGGVQVARVNCEILTKPAADKLRQDLEAAAIGNRLLHDRRGPLELYAAREFATKQPRTSWVDNPDDPDHPTSLIRRLIATVSGCQWLQGQWRRLRENLKMGLTFQSHEKFLMIRLMGHQPINAVSRPEVARVFLACHVLGPQFPNAFEELRCEMLDSQFKNHKKLLERWDKVEITPKSRTAARAVLLGIIDEAIERLRLVEAEHQERADKVARQEQARLGQEDGKAGEQLRRHLGSCNRLIFGNLDAIHRFRRNEADGWGRARQERQARREENAGRNNREDEPLVVDERGTVRPARGYKGNLEEGLARYEAQFGRSGLDRPAGSRSEIEETHVRAVPDFARWTPPVEDGGVDGDATALVDPANTPLDRGDATALVDPANTPLDRGCATALVDPAPTPLDRGDATALVDPAPTPPAPPFQGWERRCCLTCCLVTEEGLRSDLAAP